MCTTGQTPSGSCLIVEVRYERMIMCSAVATTSLVSTRERSAIQLARNVTRSDATSIGAAPPAASRGRLIEGWLEDAGLLLLLTLAFPLVVLMMGAPVALVVRLLIEIGRRW